MFNKIALPVKKYLEIIFLLTLILMRVFSQSTADASYLLLAGFALFGRSQAVQALALSWLFSMLNPILVAESTLGSMSRFIIIGAAALSVMLRSRLMVKITHVGLMPAATFFFGLILIGHSVAVSPIVDVSVLKAISWTLAMMTLLAAWSGLKEVERKSLENQIFGGLFLVLICSLPLLMLPQGYSRNETGFQGVLGHPQAFGPTMALLGVWSAAGMLGDPRPPWWRVLLTGLCLVLVVLSEARTAGLGMVLGLAFAVVLAPILARQRIGVFLPGVRSPRLYLVAAIGLIAGILVGSTLTDRIGRYIEKRPGSDGLVEAYQSSRGALIENMLDNIKANPITGIGFGIASRPDEMIIERDAVFGLPTGAVVEKGVLPFQVLEELGILGALITLFWLGMAIRRASRGTVTTLAIFFTVLLLNLGESTFFSPGGMGMLPLILFAWSVSVRPVQNGSL